MERRKERKERGGRDIYDGWLNWSLIENKSALVFIQLPGRKESISDYRSICYLGTRISSGWPCCYNLFDVYEKKQLEHMYCLKKKTPFIITKI